MYDEYKSHIISIITETLSSQADDNPNDQTRLMLRNAMINDHQIPIDLAEIVASKAHIAVDVLIFSDQVFMQTVINGYADIIASNYVHAHRNYVHPREVFLNLTDGLAISFSPRDQ